MSHRPLIAGNWKMNLLREEARQYCAALKEAGVGIEGPRVLLFPPFTLLPILEEGLAGSAVEWGGQDLHTARAGAHTGDISGAHLLDWNCRWVLCGHSERRCDHAESDELVASKVGTAIDLGLEPVLCVGETLKERECGATQEVLRRQLAAIGDLIGSTPVLAYEPVWAIGTGATASPEQASEIHTFLRRTVAEVAGEDHAATLQILYGGSVKPNNCEALLSRPDIDGFLIGGASLDSATFLDIIRRCGASN